jgi:hypothetical protein
MSISGSVIVWINAFIPKDVPGVTTFLPRGANAGKTALPLPTAGKWEPFNHWKNALDPHDRGYLTDQRSFSSDMGTSVRMQSNAKISLYPPIITSYDHFTSGTKEVDIDSGETLGIDVADMSDCLMKGPYKLPIPAVEGLMKTFNTLVMNEQPERRRVFVDVYKHYKGKYSGDWFWTSIPKPGDSFAMLVEVKGAASDPLVHMAANIDYVVDFVIVVDAKKRRLLVGVFGKIDSFPAFEAYANFNGVKKTLFQILPPKGNTPFDLLGDANEDIAAAVSFPY